jgi:glycogen(starch) synthase
MKILVITARFPPYHYGGYEIRCKNIMDELSQRGYEIIILTSVKEKVTNSSHQVTNFQILRKLHLRHRTKGFIDEILCDLRDIDIIDRKIKSFQPDVIYLGHTALLSKAIMPYLAGCEVPIFYDEGGKGIIDAWEERGIWIYFIEEFASRYSILNTMKQLVIKTICTVSRNKIKSQWVWPDKIYIIFNSEYNRRNTIARGVPVKNARVIHSGIDLNKFQYRPRTKISSPVLIIDPGRIEPRKGQIDSVILLSKLREQCIDAKLFIVGENVKNSYFLEIEREIKNRHLEDQIIFRAMVTQDILVELYHQADICFFTSYQQPGFSRTPLEAMACGCMAISYGNEGSDEVIQDHYNGFLIEPGNVSTVSRIIKEMINEPEVVQKITSTARREIENYFSLRNYVDLIEEEILKAVVTH